MSEDFWQALALGFCLLLIMEGIMPFLSPQGWKNTLRQLVEADDRVVRALGLASMLLGTALLYVFR
ncbi:DUF2065 domain-containing protein [Balneatrix alpica]|uniref:DUF2065 domain-containing protein n=1 Tax=Balneatrix alpica TaxID=75684 RepID=A0ABV5ZB58_9GAMM|nr:DUF2065 domain-containing protein [Balneatrix alpica]